MHKNPHYFFLSPLFLYLPSILEYPLFENTNYLYDMYKSETGNIKNDFVRGINKKNKIAWEKLYDDFFVPLCNYSYKITLDTEVAQDIVQDIFIKLWESEITFPEFKSFSIYMYRATHNNSLKHLRDKNKDNNRLESYKDEQDTLSLDAFSDIVEEEVIRKLRTLIEQLPKARQEIIIMSLRGNSPQDIADELGLSINTVKQQKYRAYNYIRKHLYSDNFCLFSFFI